jgi:hypothetical protein
MIVAVYFHRSITAFEHEPDVDEWIIGAERVKNYGVVCIEKGNAYIFEWISRAEKTKGQRKRVRVPLTNVSAVLEVDEIEKPKTEAEKPKTAVTP